MANDFKPVILAQLGNPPPATRSERDVVYEKVRAGFDTVFEGLDAPAERDAHAHALNDAIAEIEAELAVTSAAAVLAEAAPAAATLPPPAASPGERRMPGLRTLVAAIATLAIVSACGWYLLSTERPATVQPSVRTSQTPADAVAQKDLDPAATDKGRSFQDAMSNGDAATVAFLLNSGYRPTRVELRNALLQVKYSDAVKVAIASLDADVRDIACSFTTLLDVRKPMLRPSLYDAEDAFLIMKQIGQDQWRSQCAGESGKWREALARIEQQNAQYNQPDAEKKKEAEACIGKFSTPEANERWEQANCTACPESHSSCETYCPQAPKARDANEARFFHFNRSDMSMAAMAAPRRNRAELFCNLQYMTKTTDFDLANLQRFRDLVGLLN